MQNVVTDIITRDLNKIIPGLGTLQDITIKGDRRLGFHIVNSPRFLCTLRVLR